MSNEVHPLKERITEKIIQIKTQRYKSRSDAVILVFKILTGKKAVATVAGLRDGTLSLGESIMIKAGYDIYSVLLKVVSTPNSLFKDWTFGTELAALPRSDATKAFLETVLEIFEEQTECNTSFKLKEYTQIHHCETCHKPIKGEFGFSVSPILTDEDANIRVFAEETYPCKCRR